MAHNPMIFVCVGVLLALLTVLTLTFIDELNAVIRDQEALAELPPIEREDKI